MSTFDRQQALTKIIEFRDKLSHQMQSIVASKQEQKKPPRYCVYEPKRIDISTQTVYDRSAMGRKSISSKQQIEMNDIIKQKRLVQLKEIVDDSFKNYFRTAKNKQHQFNLEIQHLHNEKKQLYKEIQTRDYDISELKKTLEKVEQANKSSANELKKSRKLWEQQHEKNTKDIKNLEKGIAEFQKEAEKLTAEINKYQNDIIVQQKRIKQLQTMYKNSQHLVDVISQQEVKISSKLQTMQIEINRNNSYIEYIENLYLDELRKENTLEMQIQYFRIQAQTVSFELQKVNEELSFNQSEKNFYKKLNESLLQVLDIQRIKNQLLQKIDLREQQNSQNQENFEVEHMDSICKLINCFQSQENHNNLVFQVQNKIFNEELLLQKCRFEIQREEKQHNMSNLIKVSLKQALKQKDSYSSLSQDVPEDQQQSQFSHDSIRSSDSSDETQGFHSQREVNITKKHIQLPQSQRKTRVRHRQFEQSSHKQIQTIEVHEFFQINNLEHKISLGEKLFADKIQRQHENRNVDKGRDLLSPQSKPSYRPPSFGNQNGVDIVPSEFDKEAFQTQTPHFTQIQSNQSQPRSDSPQGFHLTQSVHHTVQHLSNFATSCLKKKQTAQYHATKEVKVTRILKDLKGSEQIMHMEKENASDQNDLTQNNKMQRNDRKSLPNIRINMETPQSKEAYCQATAQGNCPGSREKEKDQIKFIKKHESMTNYFISHPLSSSQQKQQSDCHLMIEKINKHQKRRIDFKLPHNENQKIKRNLKDLERELFQNIQAHKSMWRKLDRDKFNRILGCPKLSQRLAELIHKQTSIEQQIIINEHNYHQTQISNSSPGIKGEQKQSGGNKNDKFLINEELQVMIELQRLIRDTYEWILLVQRLNKREYDKQERLAARIGLKKTKTNIHRPFKGKQSIEDKNETDSLVDMYKEKSVYSEGDSPRIVGDVDHFDISPYEHNEIPQKYEEIRSLEKLFKQGQQISQISSVKNQSQVSSFINARSEFANILYSKNFIKVQDQEIHQGFAPGYHESIENTAQIQVNLNSANHVYKHRQPLTSPKNAHHPEQFHTQNKCDVKSITSVRHMSSQQKDKIKSLQKKNEEVSNYYKKIIQKMKEDQKKTFLKMQNDFNKALTMALKHQSAQVSNSATLVPSTQKEIENSQQIKILQNNEIKSSLAQIKSLQSKFQSKSLTQIALISQKISQKDEILEQKIESYEQNIDQLKMKNEEIKASLTTKTQLLEEMQKKLKMQKIQNQKIEKKCEELRKEVQLLKTQNKKIKNEFSQFMTKLVTTQKQKTVNFIKRFESSGGDNQNGQAQIHFRIPEFVKYAQSLVFTSEKVQPISMEEQRLPTISQNHEKESGKQESNKVESSSQTQIHQIDFSCQTQENKQEKGINTEIQNINTEIQNVSKEISQKQLEIQSKNLKINSLKQELKNNDVQLKQLEDQVAKLTQQNCELNENVDMLAIQISQKAVEISELTNAFKSIQSFEKRLQEKLQEAEDKIQYFQANKHAHQPKHYQTPIRKLNQYQNDQKQSPSTLLNNQEIKNKQKTQKTQTRRKKSLDSLGSMQQKFFDLQNEKEFNNIVPSSQPEKDQKMKPKNFRN